MASASAQPAALSAEQAKGEEPSLGVGHRLGGGHSTILSFSGWGPCPLGWREDELIGLLAGLGPLIPASSVLWARPPRSAALSGMLRSRSGLGRGDPSVLGPRECRAHGRG